MVLESNTLEFLFLKDGEKGEPGGKGDDGKTLYTWIKYSQNADGSNMTDDPNDAIYIGLSYNHESEIESNNPTDYNWTKIKGKDGEQGADAYTILLTNENISFATDQNRKPLSNQSHTCEVIVLQGTEVRTDFTIGTITGMTGISTSVANRVITLSSTTSTAIASDSGKFSIPIIVDGTLFTKIITFSVSKQGIQGESGSDAKSLDLYSSTYAVAFDSNGNLKDSSDIILTANQQNFTDSITWSTIPSVTLGTVSGNVNQRTLSPSLFNNNNQIQIIINSGDLSDVVTLVKVQDGSKGADGTSVTIKGSYTLDEWNDIKDSLIQSAEPGDGYIVDGDLYTFDGTSFINCGQIKGDKGDAGDDAYTIILSNEAHTFAGNTTSAIAASTKCEVIAYKGTTQMPVTIGTITGLPTGMTAPTSNNGTKNAYFSPAVTTSMTTKSGTLTIPITVDGKTFTKYFSYALALQGEQGGNGISVSSVSVQYYQSASATELIGGSWSIDRPTWVDGKYIWSKQITTLSNGSTSETDPVCITGGTGNTGATGRSVEDIITEYYLSTSKTEQVGGSWSETQQDWSNGHYVWTRSKIIYSNPSSTEYTTPICDTTWEAMQSQIDTITETMSGVVSKVDANTKSITNKVWQTDIAEKINNYDNTTTKELRDRVTKTETDITGIRSEVSDVKTTVKSKADGSTVMELEKTVSENKQDVDSFKTTVSKTYATKDSLNDYSTTEQVQSAIEQKADAILGTITDSEGNSTTYQGTLAGLATQVEDAEGNITQLQQTSQEISLKVGNAEKLALESKVLSVNLSVESMNVATDTDGNNGSYSNCKTTVSVFYGIENVTSNATITCTPSTGVTGSWNATSKIYTVSNMTVDNGTVSITSTYKVTIDGTEKTLADTKTFSITKSKQGIVGEKGEFGEKGEQGVSVKSITPEYYLSTSSTEVVGGSWVTIPPVKTDDTYIWKREHTIYDNGTESYSSAVLDQSLNKLFEATAQLKVGQDNITAEINDAKGSSATLKVRLEGIESTITDTENSLQSQITQNADDIKLKVSTDEMNSAINAKADEINLSVSKKKDATGTAIRYIRDWLNGVITAEGVLLNTLTTELPSDEIINTTNRWVECQVMVSGTNIASGITPICYDKSLSQVTISNADVYTDELLLDQEGTLTEQYIETSTESCLQIDLGEIRYDIDSIQVWHYYLDNRVYNHRLQISTDGISWVTLYDSDVSGGYLETQDGKKYFISDNGIESEMSSIKLGMDSISMTVEDLNGGISRIEQKADEISSTVGSLEDASKTLDERILDLVGQVNDYKESNGEAISQIQQNLTNIISRVATVEENGVMKDSTIVQDASGWKALFAELGMYDMENVETYITMDIHGMTIENKAAGKRTVITTEEFAGYYNDDKVFYLDEYGCLTKRIYIEKGWDTGVIKMTTISYPNSSTGQNVGGVAYVVSGGKS